MPRKENTKAKTWERARRTRMNTYFKTLDDLLPPLQEGRKRNKVDILVHASKYIKDLNSRTDELFHAHASEAHKEELNKLKKLVAQLVSRTQLLSTLLKDAGITAPEEPGLEKISPLKWSNKINVVVGEKQVNGFDTKKKSEEKTGKGSNLKALTKRSRAQKSSTTLTVDNCPDETIKVTIEDQENRVNSTNSEKNTESDNSPKSSEELAISAESIKETKSDNEKGKKIKRKKRNEVNKIQTAQSNSTPIGGFPSGTLVLSGGKILPVVTPVSPLAPNIIMNAQPRPPNPIILNNGSQNQMIVVQSLQANPVQNSVISIRNETMNSSVQNMTLGTLLNPRDWSVNVKTILDSSRIGGHKGILPKGKELAKTAMNYKVPIRAVYKEKVRTNAEVKISTTGERPAKVKNVQKSPKNQRFTKPENHNTEDLKESSKNQRQMSKSENPEKQPMKRKSNSKSDAEQSKKPKFDENISEEAKSSPIVETHASEVPATCKSIENLKQVVEKIGEDLSYIRVESDCAGAEISTVTSKDQKTEELTLTSSIEIPPDGSASSVVTVDESKNPSIDCNEIESQKQNETLAEPEEKLNDTENERPKLDSSESIPEQKERDSTQLDAAEPSALNNSTAETQTDLLSESGKDETLPVVSELTSQEPIVDENVDPFEENRDCNIVTGLDNLLQSNPNDDIAETVPMESNKVFLNLDTNTTTTMKLEVENKNDLTESPGSSLLKDSSKDEISKLKTEMKDDSQIVKPVSYSPNNSFIPISSKTDSLHSDLSNDIFASLQVPSASHNPESISPTAAFLMAFPLVSSLSGKTEVLDEELKEDFKYQSQTPPMLLQIGAIEPNSFKLKNVSNSESIVASAANDLKSTHETTTTLTTMTSTTSSVKTLPKMISSETLKEAYKIVQPTQVMKISNDVTSIPDNSSNILTSNGNIEQSTTAAQNVSPTDIVQDYASNSKPQTSFNYAPSKDITLNTLATSSMASHSQSKYNANTVRSSEQYNYGCQTTTDQSDICKIQICPMEPYSDRNNENSFENMRPRDYKEIPYSNSSNVHNTDCTSSKPLQPPVQTLDQQKIPGVQMLGPSQQQTQRENFGSIKKINEMKKINEPNERVIYQKKIEIPMTTSYSIPYEKNSKKVMTSSSSSSVNDKPPVSRNSFPQNTFVTTSYEEANLSRSTTTVAPNTSNFSILSWTTFSPPSNNIAHFDQTTSVTESSQNKTVCDNFNYVPTSHKEILPNTSQPSYPISETQTFDKSKKSHDIQKRSYIDPTKSRNVRPTNVAPPQKSSRIHSQAQATDYKFNEKNKYKYSVDMDYIHEFSLDPSHQPQHLHQQSKGQAHILKSDKSRYAMPDYDPQQFESETNVQHRYSNVEVFGFKYGEKQQNHHKYQSSQSTVLHDNLSYADNKHLQQQPQQNQHQHIRTEQMHQNLNKKAQVQQQQQQQQQQQLHQQTMRPPVNWMMTPEIKHNSNIDIILPPIGKELEFCQNNIFSQTPGYNQPAANHQFYNNYEVPPHGFPNISAIQGEPKRSVDPSFYSDEQPFTWSPTKNVSQSVDQGQTLKVDVPSTLPTLVGDLALGTNMPEKQNFSFSQTSVRNSNEQGKESKVKDRDYHAILNSQNVQHTSQSMSFLSVSQLVEHEKAEKNQQQQHQQHHHQQQHHQQQQQQPSTRKQRKSNNSPRASGKRLEMRKNASEQLHRHDEKNGGFSDQAFHQQQQQQQQKYQQNEVHWRSRNCKSNYTAEALIGTNNSNNDNEQEKNLAKYSNYSQNKFTSLPSDAMPINYVPNVDDTNSGYGQVVNQNFNHSYAYSSNANIYPTSNFITNISNTPTNYMMSLHENPEYLESNNFLLPPNVTTTAISTPTLTNMSGSKNHQYVSGKHQNCDKRLYFTQQKKSKRKVENAVQNFEFPLSGITSPLDDYHHTSSFLTTHANPLYQNHPQANVYSKPINSLAPPPPPPPPSSLPLSVSGTQGITSSNPMAMAPMTHHPSGTSLTNFNLSTIFPEINDKVSGYKSSGNGITAGLSQSTSHTPTSYSQRSSYTNSLGQMPQVTESTVQFSSEGTMLPSSAVAVRYKQP